MANTGNIKHSAYTRGGLDFEAQLWAPADKMRGHMDTSDYKHVCLGIAWKLERMNLAIRGIDPNLDSRNANSIPTSGPILCQSGRNSPTARSTSTPRTKLNRYFMPPQPTRWKTG
jgi:hypothetical protein